MTLRARLRLVTVSVVAVVVLVLLALHLNSLVVTWLDSTIERCEVAGRQTLSLIMRRVDERSAELDRPPATIAETKRIWTDIVSDDEDIADFLEKTMAQSRSVVEINVAGEDSKVVASSNPSRIGRILSARQGLLSLRQATPLGRFLAVLLSSDDYETRMPLGIPGQSTAVFTVQILASTVLLRDAVKPELYSALAVSVAALIAAMALAYWTANLALRPLARIGHLIDAIVRGDPIEKNTAEVAGRELFAIESKLSILGEQFRGARQDATQLRSNLDKVLEKLDAETRDHFENQLVISRRLSAINSLTGRVAHEIKNPLNSIALRLELLRSRLAEEAPAAESEIRVLSEEVTRLDRVVKTFLDFNRPLQLALERVGLGELMHQVADFLRPEATAKGIEIVLTAPVVEVTVRGDADLLKQAVMNIAVNAIEAMESGGRLSLDVLTKDSAGQIRISDTGPGIPLDQQSKIFDLYFTTKSKGTGIGLAMAFRSAQLHGGTIEIESEPGNGATFCIELPLMDTEETTA